MDDNKDEKVEEIKEEKKEIEIVTGDGSNLDISNVYDHLNAGKPKNSEDKPKNIIIPEEHKNIKNEENDEK